MYLLLRIVRKRTTKSWNQSDLDKSLKDKRQPQTLHVSDAWSCLLHTYGINVLFTAINPSYGVIPDKPGN